MIIKTTGSVESVTIGSEGNAITLTHPQSYDLDGPDSQWDSDDLLNNRVDIVAATKSGSIEVVRADNDLKIYRFIDDGLSALSVIPIPALARPALKGLHKKRSLAKGELTLVEYFESMALDPNTGMKTGTNLIARETRVYTPGPFGPVMKNTSIQYIRNDGTDGPTVTLEPTFYDVEESRTAGRRRRRNVIDGMTIQVIGMLIATQTSGDQGAATAIGKSYLSAIAATVSLYIESGDTALYGYIAMDPTPWLDNVIAPPTTTIRHYILGELS